MELPISQKTYFVVIEATKKEKHFKSVYMPRGRPTRVLIKLKSNFLIRKEYQLIAKTHKHITPRSPNILEYMFNIHAKL